MIEMQKQQLTELQQSRRLQSRLNLSCLQLHQEERKNTISLQNERVKLLLKKFKEEKKLEEQKRQIDIYKEQLEKQMIVLQLKQKNKLISREEMRKHQERYLESRSKKSLYIEELKQSQLNDESFYQSQVKSRLFTKVYEKTLNEEKKIRFNSEDKLKQAKQMRLKRFQYDHIVKDLHQFDTIIDPSMQLQGRSITIDSTTDQSKQIGNQYLIDLRKLPKMKQKQSKLEEQSKQHFYIDYLTQIRTLRSMTSHKQNNQKLSPDQLKQGAFWAQTKSLHSGIKSKYLADKYLISSIKYKLELLEQDQ